MPELRRLASYGRVLRAGVMAAATVGADRRAAAEADAAEQRRREASRCTCLHLLDNHFDQGRGACMTGDGCLAYTAKG